MDERATALRFLELTNNIAVTVDFDGTILHANAAAQRSAGAALEGRALRSLVHPEDHAELTAARERLLRGDGHAELEVRLGSEAWGWRWQLVTATTDVDRRSVYAIGQDVTERRRAATRLAEAEDRFRAAFENASIGMMVTSLDGRWLRVNAAFCQLVARSEEELLGRRVQDITHQDDAALTDTAIRDLLEGRRTTAMNEKRYLRPDGSEAWVLRSASLVREGDAPRYFISHAVDITERRAAEEALRASETRFRTLAAAAPNGIWAADRSGACIYANDRLGAIVGLSSQHLLGFGWHGLLGARSPSFMAEFQAELREAGAAMREMRIATPTGDARFVRCHAGTLRDPAGAITGFVGSLEDVTAEARNRQELSAREAELRLLAEKSSDFLARLSPQLEVRYASPASRTLVGYAPDELVGRRIDELVVGEDHPKLREAAAALTRNDAATVVCRVRRRDNRILWFESTLTPVLDRAGELIELVCVARDITERKAAELQLAHQAMHDALTGLPNRALFLDRLHHALLRRVRAGTGTLAVLFLDVDRFKVINDSLGHDAGDRLLVDVAGRLDAALRPADTVARFGGDEFTVLCEDIAGEVEAVAIAQRIVDLFAEPYELEGREVFLSTSVGIALASGTPAQPPRPDELIRDADAAMYRAKDRGKARYELFDAAMRDHALQRLEVENALRRAVEREELRIHLQPEIAVDGGAIVGFEALVRWEHPERGLLSPAEFIPLAEETGLIIAIGEWVLRHTCAEAALWEPGGLGISVNVSARQLAHGDFVEVVRRTLQETGLPPEALCLELTESAVIESGAATLATLNGLKGLGVKLAIDDFGTGWSSLGHLRRFPIDVVKLDRSFVSGLGTAPQDASIAAAIISLAHALGLSTVAEGIETDEQLAVLASLGCDLGQGYLFARPAPLDTFAAFLASR
jgi:diguanylate cyclase (GGDEF)-like protein/PAS domain S-box-containing protein